MIQGHHGLGRSPVPTMVVTNHFLTRDYLGLKWDCHEPRQHECSP